MEVIIQIPGDGYMGLEFFQMNVSKTTFEKWAASIF